MITVALFWAACAIAPPHKCDPAEVPLAPMVRTIRQCDALEPIMVREKMADGFRVTMTFCRRVSDSPF